MPDNKNLKKIQLLREQIRQLKLTIERQNNIIKCAERNFVNIPKNYEKLKDSIIATFDISDKNFKLVNFSEISKVFKMSLNSQHKKYSKKIKSND